MKRLLSVIACVLFSLGSLLMLLVNLLPTEDQ